MASNRTASLDFPESQDILVLHSNAEREHDLIIGDVHGAASCLEAILRSLKPYDRLFIVGDLTDKGPDSLAVITMLVNFKQTNPHRLFIVKGNHEVTCLRTINALIRIEKKIQAGEEDYIEYGASLKDILQTIKLNYTSYDYRLSITSYSLKAVISQYFNQGDWLIELFLNELNQGLIKIDKDNVVYDEGSQIRLIKAFMQSLPYIIHVKGDDPFNIVHSDMPFSDKELLQRIENGGELTNAEISHALYTRDYTKTRSYRRLESIITYVGHTIISAGVRVVRYELNTVNLDVGAYHRNVFLVVNHTLRNCYFGTLSDARYLPVILIQAAQILTSHLQLSKPDFFEMADDLKPVRLDVHQPRLRKIESKPFPSHAIVAPTTLHQPTLRKVESKPSSAHTIVAPTTLHQPPLRKIDSELTPAKPMGLPTRTRLFDSVLFPPPSRNAPESVFSFPGSYSKPTG